MEHWSHVFANGSWKYSSPSLVPSGSYSKPVTSATVANGACIALEFKDQVLDMAVVAKAVKSCISTLLSLSIVDCKIGDSEALILAELLNSNSKLLTLNVSCNSIGDQGVAAICDALKSSKAITQLDFSANQIKKAGRSIADFLRANDSLVFINLNGNEMQKQCLNMIGSALKSKSSLYCIQLPSRCDWKGESVGYMRADTTLWMHSTVSDNKKKVDPTTKAVLMCGEKKFAVGTLCTINRWGPKHVGLIDANASVDSEEEIADFSNIAFVRDQENIAALSVVCGPAGAAVESSEVASCPSELMEKLQADISSGKCDICSDHRKHFDLAGLSGAEYVRMVIDCIKARSDIPVVLAMWEFEVGNEGAAHVAEFAKVNKSTFALIMNTSGCGITEDGVKVIADAVTKSSKTLYVLGFGEHTAEYLPLFPGFKLDSLEGMPILFRELPANSWLQYDGECFPLVSFTTEGLVVEVDGKQDTIPMNKFFESSDYKIIENEVVLRVAADASLDMLESCMDGVLTLKDCSESRVASVLEHLKPEHGIHTIKLEGKLSQSVMCKVAEKVKAADSTILVICGDDISAELFEVFTAKDEETLMRTIMPDTKAVVLPCCCVKGLAPGTVISVTSIENNYRDFEANCVVDGEEKSIPLNWIKLLH